MLQRLSSDPTELDALTRLPEAQSKQTQQKGVSHWRRPSQQSSAQLEQGTAVALATLAAASNQIMDAVVSACSKRRPFSSRGTNKSALAAHHKSFKSRLFSRGGKA